MHVFKLSDNLTALDVRDLDALTKARDRLPCHCSLVVALRKREHRSFSAPPGRAILFDRGSVAPAGPEHRHQSIIASSEDYYRNRSVRPRRSGIPCGATSARQRIQPLTSHGALSYEPRVEGVVAFAAAAASLASLTPAFPRPVLELVMAPVAEALLPSWARVARRTAVPATSTTVRFVRPIMGPCRPTPSSPWTAESRALWASLSGGTKAGGSARGRPAG